MADPQPTIQSRAKLWGAVAIAVLLAIWLGVPTFNKWRADSLVDELCAKDGGIKVYETVTLPAERFNKWGQFEIPNEKVAKETDEYFRVWEIANIVGRRETAKLNELIVYRHHFKFYRKRDRKLLGELISYARRGGDPIGPWHPSSYACPDKVGDVQTAAKIFVKQPCNNRIPGAPALDKRDRTSKSLSRSRARRVDLLRRPRPPCGRQQRRPQWLYASQGSAIADYAPALRYPWRAAIGDIE